MPMPQKLATEFCGVQGSMSNPLSRFFYHKI